MATTAKEDPAGEFVDILESMLMRMHQSQRSLFRRAKLTPLHLYILVSLTKESRENAAGLAKQIGVRPQTMTPIIDALEAGGLVRRVPDPKDRRATILVLTPRGTGHVRSVRAAQRALVGNALSSIPKEDIKAATRTLSAVRDYLSG